MNVVLHRGDAVARLAQLADCSIDAVICDPPYGLSGEPDVAEVLTHWLAGDDYHHSGNGFMGKSWDSFVPGPAVWRECLRVLKPGGHLLAFAGSRTVDLMGMAIRLGGFEIRDQIQWLNGSGFPKSMNVSKAFDKAAGKDAGKDAGPSTSDLAQEWEGWGTNLKPAHEPIVVARKPLDGTVTNTVRTHGTGAINIDACRIGTVTSDGSDSTLGRWPANVVLTHHEDCVEVGTTVLKGGRPIRVSEQRADTIYESSVYAGRVDNNSLAPGSRSLGAADQEIPVFDCHPDCPIRALDEQTGTLTSGKPAGGDGPHLRRASVGAGGGYALEGSADGSLRSEGVEFHLYGDSGGASRFFYCSKTSKSERHAGLPEDMKNSHPTVKPVELMRWLVKMVTPPGGVVLDPFCGSGTTLVAATLEGHDSVGIDRDDDDEYLKIAAARIAHAGGVATRVEATEPGHLPGDLANAS